VTPRHSPSQLDLVGGGLLLFGALVRIVGFLQNASLTGDEAMLALNLGRRSFRQLLQPLDYGQIATVPFLWAERLVVLGGGMSGYTLRLIPVLAGIGLLWVVYRLAGALLGRTEALVALALSATAFPLIRYSIEVKPYIIDGLVSALLIWIAVRLADDLEDRRWWARLAVAGSLAVLISTPALLVGAAAGAGLAIAALRRRRWDLLARLALLELWWGGLFGAAYCLWYAPNASAPYMREFWGEAFLWPGSPHFLARLGLGLQNFSCTLTCWRGALDLSPVLLLLAVGGVVTLARRRGLEYAVLIVGPIVAALAASMLGRYPIATRLVLFAAPSLAILVATGSVVAATRVERSWPAIRARWVLFLLLYPSVIPAVTLAFAPPNDWGILSVEVRPLAQLFRERGGGEPVYVFPRAVPAWVFHTTDWSAPDSARLRWVAQVAGARGLGFVNGPSRGRRPIGEGTGMVYQYAGGKELYGTSTGVQIRTGGGYNSLEPDPGWAESEAWRMRAAARPFIWVVLSDYAHGPLDEGAFLLKAVAAAGGEVVFRKAAADAELLRVYFPPAGTE
jgi:hypothetical protein